ncbi:MAG: hypothetical protein HRT57_13655 [Crocinitomicaceae bacterium]|nr:hypothetical protein [Crocinitomicaceae bacterium]
MVIAEASVTGLIRMLLLIVGAFVLLRIVGQWLNNKNNSDESKRQKESKKRFEQEKKRKKQSLGKTNVLRQDPSKDNDFEDVDFEEID